MMTTNPLAYENWARQMDANLGMVIHNMHNPRTTEGRREKKRLRAVQRRFRELSGLIVDGKMVGFDLVVEPEMETVWEAQALISKGA
jgi:hypothetical protein